MDSTVLHNDLASANSMTNKKIFLVENFLKESRNHVDNVFQFWRTSGKTYMIPPDPITVSLGSNYKNASRSRKVAAKRQSALNGNLAEATVHSFLSKSKQHAFILQKFDTSRWGRIFGTLLETSNSFDDEINEISNIEIDFLILHAFLGVIVVECKAVKKYKQRRYTDSKKQLDKVDILLKNISKMIASIGRQTSSKQIRSIDVLKVVSFPFAQMKQGVKDPYNLGPINLKSQPELWWENLLKENGSRNNRFVTDTVYQDTVLFLLGIYCIAASPKVKTKNIQKYQSSVPIFTQSLKLSLAELSELPCKMMTWPRLSSVSELIKPCASSESISSYPPGRCCQATTPPPIISEPCSSSVSELSKPYASSGCDSRDQTGRWCLPTTPPPIRSEPCSSSEFELSKQYDSSKSISIDPPGRSDPSSIFDCMNLFSWFYRRSADVPVPCDTNTPRLNASDASTIMFHEAGASFADEVQGASFANEAQGASLVVPSLNLTHSGNGLSALSGESRNYLSALDYRAPLPETVVFQIPIPTPTPSRTESLEQDGSSITSFYELTTYDPLDHIYKPCAVSSRLETSAQISETCELDRAQKSSSEVDNLFFLNPGQLQSMNCQANKQLIMGECGTGKTPVLQEKAVLQDILSPIFEDMDPRSSRDLNFPGQNTSHPLTQMSTRNRHRDNSSPISEDLDPCCSRDLNSLVRNTPHLSMPMSARSSHVESSWQMIDVVEHRASIYRSSPDPPVPSSLPFDATTKGKIFKSWSLSTAENLLFLNFGQLKVMNSQAKKQLIMGEARTGKTFVLQEKAFNMLMRGESVSFLIPKNLHQVYQCFEGNVDQRGNSKIYYHETISLEALKKLRKSIVFIDDLQNFFPTTANFWEQEELPEDLRCREQKFNCTMFDVMKFLRKVAKAVVALSPDYSLEFPMEHYPLQLLNSGFQLIQLHDQCVNESN